jgi:predicted SprT family Zn-dependent metalloprotease
LKSLDNLLMTVISEAKALNIPVSDKIDSKVAVNSRAVRRFGCCIVKDNKFYIEISSKLLDAPEQMRKQTLAHEILHTCPGCKNHGNRWKQYAQKMNSAYGYNISRATTHEQLGIDDTVSYRYLLKCQNCGAEIKRMRRSKLTDHPELYRCKCGGKLNLTDPQIAF